MDKHAIMTVYEKVSGVMGLMVQAAEASEWDMLTELESQCAAYVDVLKSGDSHEGLTSDEMEHKIKVIQKILDDDLRIRELTESRMKELGELIRHSSTTRKLNRAYRASMPS